MSADEKREFEEINERANHYMRWLLKDMNHIKTDIEMNVIAKNLVDTHLRNVIARPRSSSNDNQVNVLLLSKKCHTYFNYWN